MHSTGECLSERARERERACGSIIIAFYGFISFVTDIERAQPQSLQRLAERAKLKFIESMMVSLHWQHRHAYR